MMQTRLRAGHSLEAHRGRRRYAPALPDASRCLRRDERPCTEAPGLALDRMSGLGLTVPLPAISDMYLTFYAGHLCLQKWGS